jgi:phage terminase small subunit
MFNPTAQHRPSEQLRKMLPPEEIARMEQEIVEETRRALEAKARLETPLTQKEILELQKHHRPCPWDGPHEADCNLLECIYALAEKRAARGL